eukprot:639110-Lingulodinium_polyedra.AAC.1
MDILQQRAGHTEPDELLQLLAEQGFEEILEKDDQDDLQKERTKAATASAERSSCREELASMRKPPAKSKKKGKPYEGK